MPSITTYNYFKKMSEDYKAGVQLTRGQTYAFRAWRNTVEYNAETFEATEIPWGSALADGVMSDFINTLREASLETFAVTDQSTALMEGLHAILASGCSIIGPIVVRHHRFGEDEESLGLEIKIN